jgi:exodeoxyribonuclease-3
MQIATWNVNSIRARMERLLAWLSERRPDVVCLQETKCTDDKFPREPIEELGYAIACFGQKTYNGVAILTRSSLEDVSCGIGDERFDEQARVIAANVGDVIVVSVYVVNGRAVGSEQYAWKLEWLDRLAGWIAERCPPDEKVVVAGDFNVTFDDRDVHDPDAWRERILCSTPEREALAELMRRCDLHDAFRAFTSEGGHYTWWDFRTRAFRRGFGLRIDHVLMTPPALAACTGVEIDVEARAGTGVSDHAPVIATLAP